MSSFISSNILNEWELWKSSSNQNQDENRSRALQILKDCNRLSLHLEHLHLSTVPNTFPYGLTFLHLGWNKLSSLPDCLPKSLYGIEATNNEIVSLPETLPELLCQLELGNNKLVSLPKRFPKYLQMICVSNNFITNVKFNSKTITRLFIKNNGIEKILEEHFHLPNLQCLDVSHNKLTSLPTNLPETLNYLLVSHNKLSIIQDSLPKSIHMIDADHNEIRSVPEILPEMLMSLKLRNNKLVSLPNRLLPKYLQNLYLSNNFLTNVKFNSGSLVVLHIENNGIEKILEEQFNLPCLYDLDVSYNKLTSLPTNLPKTLKYLKVSHNKLSIIQDSLPNGLYLIDADHNEITSLPEKLPEMLDELKLRNNKLEYLPKRLPKTLRALYLSNNFLWNLKYNSADNTVEYSPQLIRSKYEPDILMNNRVQDRKTMENTRPLLIEELKNWLATESIHPYWNTIAEDLNSLSFSQFLNRLRKTPNLKIEYFKVDMAKWLYELGEDNNSKQKLREKVFLVAAESYDRHVLFYLNQMKILSVAVDVELGKYDYYIEELIRLARGMYRLNVLDQILKQKVWETRCFDEIHLYLEYQIRLQERFDLPNSELKIENHFIFDLSNEDIERAAKEITDRERIEFVDYLLIDWQPWKEVLKRWNSDRFFKCESDVHNIELFNQELYERKLEYLLETKMSSANDELPLDVQIELGSQVQRKIEKDIWLQLSHQFLESNHLELEIITESA